MLYRVLYDDKSGAIKCLESEIRTVEETRRRVSYWKCQYPHASIGWEQYDPRNPQQSQDIV